MLAEPAYLTLKQVVAIWEKLNTRFTDLESLDAVRPTPGTAEPDTFAFGQMFGTRFIDVDGNLFAEIQPRRVSVKWSSRGLQERDVYPGYEALFETLRMVLESASEAVPGAYESFIVGNMAYEDFQRSDALPTMKFLRQYLTREFVLEGAADAERFHSANVSWQFEDGIDYRLIAQSVAPQFGDISVHGLSIKTIAGVKAEATSDWHGLVMSVHDRLNKVFVDMITDYAKAEWEYEHD